MQTVPATIETTQPKVEEELSGLNYGRFTIEPLEAGYGTTLGNALRRILLRSLPGVAVSRVRIADVWHEFSALPNVKEDVTELILNLKQIYLREETELRGEVHARLYARGRREVTAGDVEWPSEVECVNPELHLATLDNDDAVLEMEITIERGRGYRPAEAQESLTIGEIPLDAIFTPIKKVNYTVEHTRVGHQTDYDRLVLEIVTNGTIEPGDALAQSGQILAGYGQIIGDFNREDGLPAGQRGPFISQEAEAKSLAELGLPPRVLNALKSRGIERVGQVLAMDPDDLLSIRNFGPQSLTDLRAKLQEHGFMPDLPEGSEDAGDAGEADTLSLLQDISPEASTFAYGEGELVDDEPEDEQ